jgi:lipopolysaccharide assembly outer membrane protein LptD (OstA)
LKKIIFIILTLGIVVGVAASQVNRAEQPKHTMISTPDGQNVGITADSIERHEPDFHAIQLNGNVQIKTADMLLRTDEAVYNESTGEIEAHGTVRVKLENQH